jgi:hypothetical protein
MPTLTNDIRLQPRWTVSAFAGGAGLPSTAAAWGKRGAGCFAAVACGMSGRNSASEPGRARFGSDDT